MNAKDDLAGTVFAGLDREDSRSYPDWLTQPERQIVPDAALDEREMSKLTVSLRLVPESIDASETGK
jgi:hypothetical protein